GLTNLRYRLSRFLASPGSHDFRNVGVVARQPNRGTIWLIPPATEFPNASCIQAPRSAHVQKISYFQSRADACGCGLGPVRPTGLEQVFKRCGKVLYVRSRHAGRDLKHRKRRLAAYIQGSPAPPAVSGDLL